VRISLDTKKAWFCIVGPACISVAEAGAAGTSRGVSAVVRRDPNERSEYMWVMEGHKLASRVAATVSTPHHIV
jgi:hypothetical protein